MGFAENLRKLRMMRGMTQVAMAERLGVDKSTYNGYESGKRKPDVQRIKEIAAILNVSADELLETRYLYREYLDTVNKKTAKPADAFVDAINNRAEFVDLLRMAMSSSTEEVHTIIMIWKVLHRQSEK